MERYTQLHASTSSSDLTVCVCVCVCMYCYYDTRPRHISYMYVISGYK